MYTDDQPSHEKNSSNLQKPGLCNQSISLKGLNHHAAFPGTLYNLKEYIAKKIQYANKIVKNKNKTNTINA